MSKDIMHLALVIAFALATSFACNPKPIPETADELGCPRPAASVFTQAGLDASLDSSTFGKVITGNVVLKITPAVVDLMSKTSRNEQIISWIVCRDQKNGLIQTPEQLQYAKNAARFYSLSPTPEQAIQWHTQNPFPGGTTISVKGKLVSKNGEPIVGANVTIRYQGELIAGGSTDSNGAFSFRVPIKYHDAELEVMYQVVGFAQARSKLRIFAPATELKPFKVLESEVQTKEVEIK
jgi:hypothetical protein